MDEIYINILARITASLPQLSLVDEDYGQLEMAEEQDRYPVTFPCALIGYADTEWSDLTPDSQRGQATVTVRLAIDCYADTHATSGTYDAVHTRHQLAAELNKALRRFRPATSATGLTRRHSREYALPGGIKVFELTYGFRITD